MVAMRLLLILAAITVVSAQGTLPPLPLFSALPEACGRVAQVQHGDTCDSIAALAGITMDEFTVLNPLILCGITGLQPGSAVCTGNTITFCNDVYVADSGDTCAKISDDVGTVVNVAGTEPTTCNDLTSGVPVCVSPDPSVCAVDTLCGVHMPQPLQDVLTLLTDYCSIVAECQIPISVVDIEGKQSLALTINSVTPAVQAVAGKDGHPELGQFVSSPKPLTLDVTITPEWYADGSGLVATEFQAPTSARRFSRRRLLTDGVRGAQTRVPRKTYGYGR